MAEMQYIFTKRFEDILGKKFKSPCHISDEDKALVVDMIVNPIPFIQSGSNWVNITPAKNWNTFVVRKDTTTQAKQNSVSLVQNPTYKKIAENFCSIRSRGYENFDCLLYFFPYFSL